MVLGKNIYCDCVPEGGYIYEVDLNQCHLRIAVNLADENNAPVTTESLKFNISGKIRFKY